MSTKKQPLKAGEKVLFIVAGVFLLLAIVGFAIMQYMSSQSEHGLFSSKTHYVFDADGLRGSRVYGESRCSACHRAMGSGTNMGRGSDLDGIGSRRSKEWLSQFLHHPEEAYGMRTLDHGAHKEADYVSKLPEKDLHDIVAFLSGLQAEQGSTVAEAPPKGESPFIDSMVNMWAPDSWKTKYRDIRDQPTTGDAE